MLSMFSAIPAGRDAPCHATAQVEAAPTPGWGYPHREDAGALHSRSAGSSLPSNHDCKRRDDQDDGRVGRVPRSPRGPCRGGGEGVRQGRHGGARPRRREPGPAGRALHRHHGTLGVGQVDPHALPGGARHAHVGPGVHRRGRPRPALGEAADPAAARPRRLRVPGIQPAPDAERRGEHHPAARPGRTPEPTPKWRTAWPERPGGEAAESGKHPRRVHEESTSAGSAASSRPSGSATGSSTVRPSCRAASSSAWPWPAPWPAGPR